MKKRIYITLVIAVLVFSAYYYWQNRYVEFKPVFPIDLGRPLIVFSQNEFYRIAEPNEIPPDFYINIEPTLKNCGIDYIFKNGVIYAKYKQINDYETIWNYTTKTKDSAWFTKRAWYNKKLN